MPKQNKIVSAYSLDFQLVKLIERWSGESGSNRSKVVEALIFEQAGKHCWQGEDGPVFDRRPLKLFRQQEGIPNGA